MSTCVSRHGEYSEHTLGEGAGRFVCQLCHVFDEDAALRHIAELHDLLGQAAAALTEVGKKAIVVRPTLDKPYADDPSWSPWTRFMEKPARAAYNLGVELRRVLKASGVGSQ